MICCLGLQSLALPSGFTTLIQGVVQSSCHVEDPSVWGSCFPGNPHLGSARLAGPMEAVVWCAGHHVSQDSCQSAPRLVVLTLTLWVGRLHGFPTAELPCFLFVFNKLHVGRFSEISCHSQFYLLTFSIHE